MELNQKYIILVLFICIWVCNFTNAQSIFRGPTGSIPDYPTDTCFILSILDIFPAYVDTTFGLQKVCLNIAHPSPQDLNIVLIAPDSTNVLLSNKNGKSEEWEGLCFTMDAADSITSIDTFFDKEVLPQGNLGEFNNGQLAVGLWQLCISDEVDGNEGSLTNFQMTFNFEASDPINFDFSNVCTVNTTFGCFCPDGGDNCFLLPDLIITDTLTFTIEAEVVGAIGFNTGISNIGFGPLEFFTSNKWFCDDVPLPKFATCENGEQPKQLIKQRVYRKFPDQKAGFIDFDVGFMPYQNNPVFDNRPQISNWVENTIRIKGNDDNPLNWPIIASSSKTSFCLENTLRCTTENMLCADGDLVNGIENLPNSRIGRNYACFTDKTGIAVGYSQFDFANGDGQEIQFSATTCNGTYYLVTEFDPDSTILELNESNNVSAVKFQLTQQVDNCCKTNFSVKQLDENGSFIQFEDLTTPIPSNWIWNFGDGNISSTQFPENEYDSPGEYTISLTTENELGCSNTISKTITVKDVNVSINQFENLDFKLSILDNKYIQLSLSTSKNIVVNLLSIDGKSVENIYSNVYLNSGLYTKELPNIPTGIYLIQAIVDGSSYYKKLIQL